MPYNACQIRYCLALIVILLSPAVWLLAADGPPPHDDGVAEPYVTPKEHLEYVGNLDPALVPTLKADPAMIEQWQDDRFGVFMHWDPPCQVRAQPVGRATVGGLITPATVRSPRGSTTTCTTASTRRSTR